MKILHRCFLLVVLLVMVGCAALPFQSQPGEKSREVLLKKGVAPAQVALDKELQNDKTNQLLYLMNSGLLHHLAHEYEESNRKLSEAAWLANDLQVQRAQHMVSAALTNPEVAPYAGTVYERVFIHYYQALNYLYLVEKADGAKNRQKMLEAARVEARKVDILLNALQSEKGSYDEVVEDEDGRLFKKIFDVVRALEGRKHDPDWLVYREDAYIRYTEGLIYESNGEYNEARIAYQKAAKLYEKGYAKQYALNREIVEQAWFDAIRMMRWVGGYASEWPKLAKSKLSAASRARLDSFKRGASQLVVISHLDIIPQRQELNLHLTVDELAKQLVLRPVFTGTPHEKRAQQAWFHNMYSDTGLLDAVINYNQGGVFGAVDGAFTKRITLAPVWGLVKDIDGLLGSLQIGARVTVPYYAPVEPPFGATEVFVGDQLLGKLVDAESLALIALQEQLLNANSELRESLARELVKMVSCVTAAGKAASVLCAIGNAITSGSEARNWLNLPSAIRVQRFPVKPGNHVVKVVTHSLKGGVYHSNDAMVNIEKGEMKILRTRAISSLSGRLSR